MRVHDVEIVPAGTDDGSAIVLPCIEDDEARRFFFGPLLASASAHRHPHNLYRKVRHMASRRWATGDEMAYVRDKRPDLWACIVRERCEQKARANQSRTRNKRDSSPPRGAPDDQNQTAPAGGDGACIADKDMVGDLCLIEVTVRIVDYLAAHALRPLGRVVPVRAPKRSWPEIEPLIAEWAATRDAALLSTIATTTATEGPIRKRRRKQPYPLASLAPIV